MNGQFKGIYAKKYFSIFIFLKPLNAAQDNIDKFLFCFANQTFWKKVSFSCLKLKRFISSSLKIPRIPDLALMAGIYQSEPSQKKGEDRKKKVMLQRQ